MGNLFYLLNMTVCGIKSIREEVRLDFYKKTIDKDFNPEKYRIKAIYGENGSGKSALMTAVKIYQDLLIQDNYLNESNTQAFLHEIINKVTQKFRFSCEFIVDVESAKIVYQYTVEIGKSENDFYEIQYECLKTKNGNYVNNKYKTVFEVDKGRIIELCCEEAEKERIIQQSMNLLSRYSLMTLYMKNDNEKEKEADKKFLIHMILSLTFAVIINVYIGEEDAHEIYFLRKKLQKSDVEHQILKGGLLEIAKSLNAFASVNERTIDKKRFKNYEKRVSQLTQFIKIFKPDLVSIDIDAKEIGEQYQCDLNLNYGDYSINKEFESTGIKKLIRLFDCFVAASTTGIVFVDEMDSNLNDVYLCKLIEYFMYYGKGQLCFTTHNLDPMSVLKENKNSIDFLSSDNHLVSWTSRGNASPENCYKNGMIEDSPFNVDATDFVGILGE